MVKIVSLFSVVYARWWSRVDWPTCVRRGVGGKARWTRRDAAFINCHSRALERAHGVAAPFRGERASVKCACRSRRDLFFELVRGRHFAASFLLPFPPARARHLPLLCHPPPPKHPSTLATTSLSLSPSLDIFQGEGKSFPTMKNSNTSLTRLYLLISMK